MSVLFASARSSPGVTTAVLACASVWSNRVVIVEASEDGGAIAARFGLPPEPGATTLAAAVRHDIDATNLADHAQPLPGTDGRITALIGPPTNETAQALWRTAAGRVARLLDSVDDAGVMIDAGRLGPSPSVLPLLTGANLLVLVARPRVEELQALAMRLPVLRDHGPPVAGVLVGDRPYGPRDVARTLGLPVLGVLADDRPAADALAGHGSVRRLARSPLIRSATAVVDQLADRMSPATPSAPLSEAEQQPSPDVGSVVTPSGVVDLRGSDYRREGVIDGPRCRPAGPSGHPCR